MSPAPALSQTAPERTVAGPPAAAPTGQAGMVRLVLDALATSILCFASAHVAILLTEAVARRDASGFNIFTMLEAQRLWPALTAGPGSRWASLAFGLVVYLTVFMLLVRRRRRAAPEPVSLAWRRLAALRATSPAHTRPGANGAATNGTTTNGAHVGAVRRFAAPSVVPARFPLAAGCGAFVAGLGLHMAALAAIDRLVPAFPPVPDVVHARLPYVNFGPPGELAYALFMLAMIVILLRRQAATVPAILALLGAFYAVRGVFLFLLPIGLPPTAPPLAERFVLWPFAGHAYFPGGHTGMMTVLSLSVCSRPWRRAFLAFTFVFAVGTLLARTHYTGDAFGGWLVGYTIVLWGRRRFGAFAGGCTAARDVVRASVTRLECEA